MPGKVTASRPPWGLVRRTPRIESIREQRPKTPRRRSLGAKQSGSRTPSPRHPQHLPGGSLRAYLFRHLCFFPPALLSLNMSIFQNNQTCLQEFKLPENKQTPGLLSRQFPWAVSPSQATSGPLLGFNSNLAMIA